MAEREAEFKRQQDALRHQEELLRQQKERFEKEEVKRNEDIKRIEEERQRDEVRVQAAQEEARRQIEAAEAIQRDEQERLAAIERQRQLEEEQQRAILEAKQRELEAAHLAEELEKERIRAEKAAKLEVERKKKEEEKRVLQAAKKAIEKKAREEAEQKKLQEQMKQERLKKEMEEAEKKRKKAEAEALAKAKAAPQWKTPQQMAAAPVPSFAEIQKADQEEMKRNEKMLAKQIEAQKAAAVKTNSQSVSGWAGLVRGKNSQAPFNVQPVSPVVTTKKAPGAIKKPSAPSSAAAALTSNVQQVKPVQKQQKPKPKEELFWDSAVDAVITDKANVKNPVSAKANHAGTSDAEKAHVRQLFEKLNVTQVEDPLLAWARIELENIPNHTTVDIPTFVGFLRDLEQDFQVEDYARDFLGSGKGVLQFAQRFIEMRRKLKGGNGANGGFQTSGEKKNKKKSKKNKNKANLDLLGES